jgi:hypothetical protein
MPSSWKLRRVALLSTDVSEERILSIIRVSRISELGPTVVTRQNCTAESEPALSIGYWKENNLNLRAKPIKYSVNPQRLSKCSGATLANMVGIVRLQTKSHVAFITIDYKLQEYYFLFNIIAVSNISNLNDNRTGSVV